ncbi:MAG: AAA family ATPase [Desulfomonile sp.]|jgi:predicted ATPase
MIDTIKIQNFRCFESIQLSDCRRVNLIVGRNASGKTALLEAIFLASGASPELGLRIKGWRGEGAIVVSAEQSSYESAWKDLFYKFNQTQAISIQFVGSAGFGRSLRILYELAPAFHLPLGQDVREIQTITPVVFVYTDENGKEYKVSPIVAQGALTIGAVALPPMNSTFFPTQSPVPVQQYVGFYSALSKQKKESVVVKLLRTEFPFIRDISAEMGSSGLWVLYASLDELPEKIPVTLLSSGVTKLLFILLAIAMQPNGILLIDEIENGFYFDRLQSIWSLILRFASEYNVQIFASTHSRECLEAAADVGKNQRDKFGIIRTVKVKGTVEIRQFDGRRFVDAMDEGIEIR